MVLNDSGHPLMTAGRVVKRTTSWCFANGQETGTIGVPAVPLPLLLLLILLLLLLLLLFLLLLLLLVYRPSCANSIRRHCCWLVLLLIYCLLATSAPQVVQIAGLDRFLLFERSSLKQIDEESVCFFEIPLTTSLYSLRLSQVPGSYWSPSCGIGHCTFFMWRLKYNYITNGTFSIFRSEKHTNSMYQYQTPVSCR